ncbi:hypothetical protein, partial [Pantoea agglomerans]|uniref:hypothetical protein n=1 Tax=Enterobacter agglomerans TaxID=549 RepID=UPI0024132AAF
GEDLGLSDKFWNDGRGNRFAVVTCRVYEGMAAKEKHPQQLLMSDEGSLKFLIGTVVDLSSGSQIAVDVEMWIADDFLYVRAGSAGTPLVLSIGGDIARLQSAVDCVKARIMAELAANKF